MLDKFIEQMEAYRDRVNDAIAALQQLNAATPNNNDDTFDFALRSAAVPHRGPGRPRNSSKKRFVSVATRKKIGLAMKKRWAEKHRTHTHHWTPERRERQAERMRAINRRRNA